MGEYKLTPVGKLVVTALIIGIAFVVISASLLLSGGFEYIAPIPKETPEASVPSPSPTITASPLQRTEGMLYYADGQTKLSVENTIELDWVAHYAKENPDKLLYIEGHVLRTETGELSNEDNCKKLSLERADEAAGYLVKKGIPGYQIITEGKGSTASTSGARNRVHLYMKKLEKANVN